MPACYFIGAGLHTALGRGMEENLATLQGGFSAPSTAVAHFAGRTVREVPFRYSPREAGVSKARVVAFGPSYVRTLARCLRARFRRP